MRCHDMSKVAVINSSGLFFCHAVSIAVILKSPVEIPSSIYPDQDTQRWIANLIQRID